VRFLQPFPQRGRLALQQVHGMNREYVRHGAGVGNAPRAAPATVAIAYPGVYATNAAKARRRLTRTCHGTCSTSVTDPCWQIACRGQAIPPLSQDLAGCCEPLTGLGVSAGEFIHRLVRQCSVVLTESVSSGTMAISTPRDVVARVRDP